ncbi:hypothetical protein [Streptomyces adustus]|uniref:hypothetical protein n=1 Tax=Streptomyces adustus TaxID=1609272 RepID=UPI00371592A5
MAAPLFAGAAIATIGVLGADPDKFRWSALSMLMLTLAAIALAASIHIALRGRRFLYNADEVRSWASSPDNPDSELDAALAEITAEIQADDFEQWLDLSGRAAWAYQTGLILLGLGVASILAPLPSATTSDAALRWSAAGAVVCTLGVHAFLIIRRVIRNNRGPIVAMLPQGVVGD